MTHLTRRTSRWRLVTVLAALAWPATAAVGVDEQAPPMPGDEAPMMDGAPPAEAPMEGPPPSPMAEEAAELAAARVSDDVVDRQVHTVAGMIGQVNGQPIYARRVLDPIGDQLAAMGRQMPRSDFRHHAARLIAGQLDQIVTDALVLGAAERDLSDQERMGLRQMVRQHREELLRQHGHGSLAVTERELRRTTGQGLDDTLETYRQQVIIQRYMHQRLFPQINVTRRDIRRFYYDHFDEFNPQGERTIELIRTDDADEAQRIADALADDVPFDEAADARRLDAPGEAPLAHDELNEALAELAEGEHAGPIAADGEHWFIRVAELDRRGARSLRDAQVEIESRLRAQQFRRLSEQYRRDLYAEGSYNPIDQMTEALLEIAMSRYAASG